MHTVLVYKKTLLHRTETFIREQILACKRWRVVLIGMHNFGELPADGLTIRLLCPQHKNYMDHLRWKLSRAFGTIPRSAIDQLKDENPSLVHVHFGPDAISAWPIARRLNVPMLVTLHGYDINTYREWWEEGEAGPDMRAYPALLLEISRRPRVHFIAVSEAIRQRAISLGIPADKITVRYIGIDPDKFTPGGAPIAERQRRVLFVGRLIEKKGCEYLIQAMTRVQKTLPDAELHIVGEGILRASLSQRAQELGVRAVFKGPMSSTDVKKELDCARVFCLPSVTASNGDAEGFGMVLLEAQASGVPVVTSARGGAAEGIMDGVTGFSFPERNVDILAAKLTTLLSDSALASAMAESGPDFVRKQFDIGGCTRALELLYDSIVQTSPRRRKQDWTNLELFRDAAACAPKRGDPRTWLD